MKKTKILTFTGMIRKEEKGYSAFCPEFEVASCGDTIEEAKKNLIEAVELYLESAQDLGILKDTLEEAGFSEENDVISAHEYTASMTAHLVKT